MLYYALSANIILLACILQDPSDNEACYDRTAIQRLAQYIGNKVNNEACRLQAFLQGCVAVETMVRGAISEAMGVTDQEQTHKLGGKYHGNSQVRVRKFLVPASW